MVKMYDMSTDEYREVTQRDIDIMQACINIYGPALSEIKKMKSPTGIPDIPNNAQQIAEEAIEKVKKLASGS